MLVSDDVDATANTSRAQRLLLESLLAYHLGCLRKDATDLALTALERLALVRDRARRIREIRQELEVANVLKAVWRT